MIIGALNWQISFGVRFRRPLSSSSIVNWTRSEINRRKWGRREEEEAMEGWKRIQWQFSTLLVSVNLLNI